MVYGLERVACVEDDPDIRELIRISLSEIGRLKLAVYASGPEAIEQSPRFDPELFLIDVMMPGMTGQETLVALRGLPAFEETPMVFMTAKVQVQEVEDYYRLGAASVISKPFDPIILADQVRAIWSQAKRPSRGA
ncbi:MAG: response regulator [Bauldia sp.]|nr:response regulator [Bauldia sp.]